MGGRGRASESYYLHEGQQGKHIEGHNNYIPGRSKITIPLKRLQELFEEYSGTGIRHGTRELVNFEEVIGIHINDITGVETETTWGTIHYKDDGGYHIVPAYPNNQGE